MAKKRTKLWQVFNAVLSHSVMKYFDTPHRYDFLPAGRCHHAFARCKTSLTHTAIIAPSVTITNSWQMAHLPVKIVDWAMA